VAKSTTFVVEAIATTWGMPSIALDGWSPRRQWGAGVAIASIEHKAWGVTLALDAHVKVGEFRRKKRSCRCAQPAGLLHVLLSESANRLSE